MKNLPFRYKFGLITLALYLMIAGLLIITHFATVQNVDGLGDFSMAGFVLLVISLPGILLATGFPSLGIIMGVLGNTIAYFLVGYVIGSINDVLKKRELTLIRQPEDII
ncbi:MAG: hypothetical protein V4519_00630 [Patescibacteria group bacterium]